MQTKNHLRRLRDKVSKKSKAGLGHKAVYWASDVSQSTIQSIIRTVRTLEEMHRDQRLVVHLAKLTSIEQWFNESNLRRKIWRNTLYRVRVIHYFAKRGWCFNCKGCRDLTKVELKGVPQSVESKDREGEKYSICSHFPDISLSTILKTTSASQLCTSLSWPTTFNSNYIVEMCGSTWQKCREV